MLIVAKRHCHKWSWKTKTQKRKTNDIYISKYCISNLFTLTAIQLTTSKFTSVVCLKMLLIWSYVVFLFKWQAFTTTITTVEIATTSSYWRMALFSKLWPFLLCCERQFFFWFSVTIGLIVLILIQCVFSSKVRSHDL